MIRTLFNLLSLGVGAILVGIGYIGLRIYQFFIKNTPEDK